MNTTTRRAMLAALAVVGCAPLGALAQAAYPSKPIKMVVPLPAGGAADAASRVTAEAQGALKQPVVVDNKPATTR